MRLNSLVLQSTLKSHFFRVLFLFIYFAGLPQIALQKVWSFRTWRKSFPEWFGVSALGETCFPNGLLFPRMAKVVSRKVCYFRAWRKLFPEWFDACGSPANHFLKVLLLAGLPQIAF